MIIWINGPFGAGKTTLAKRLRDRREAAHLQEHAVQLPAPPWCRDRRVPEERQVTRPAAFGRVAGRAARRRAGGHRHPAPRGGE